MLRAAPSGSPGDSATFVVHLSKSYLPHGPWEFADDLDSISLDAGFQVSASQSSRLKLHRACAWDRTFSVIRKEYLGQNWEELHLEITTEAYFYSSPYLLRDLQGVCVPYMIAVCDPQKADATTVSHVPVSLPSSLFEPIDPCQWTTAHGDLSSREKQAIIKAYKKIHRNGILHNDIHPWNILLGPEGCVRIQSFGRSKATSFMDDRDEKRTREKAGITSCTIDDMVIELRALKYMLDFEGARQAERILVHHATATTPFSSHTLHKIELEMDLATSKRRGTLPAPLSSTPTKPSIRAYVPTRHESAPPVMVTRQYAQPWVPLVPHSQCTETFTTHPIPPTGALKRYGTPSPPQESRALSIQHRKDTMPHSHAHDSKRHRISSSQSLASTCASNTVNSTLVNPKPRIGKSVFTRFTRQFFPGDHTIEEACDSAPPTIILTPPSPPRSHRRIKSEADAIRTVPKKVATRKASH